MPDHNVKNESLSTQLKHGDVDTIETNARYLAYASRIRTALMASTRYLAYTSDVGEAFRPVVSPWTVKAAYGISWGYLAFDVSYEAYKAAKEGKDNAAIGLMAIKRGVFQSLASMALPMMTIHSIVKFSAKHVFEKAKSPKLKMWGPTCMGLSVVPFLPFIFDHPVEHVIDRVFEPIEKKV
ncbi:hypothetical protein K492DRAFT_205786 [Lichtheimia hyalospora FSU 10163]|nr:hypothetical protein K492DRAFT_205786 [Lichtheimia hyalospora FSU 10163]